MSSLAAVAIRFRYFEISRPIVIPVSGEPQTFREVGCGAWFALQWIRELQMLKIQRSMKARNVRFALSGRIESEHLAELQRLIDEDSQRGSITLDLREVRLVDREAVELLARYEANGVRLRNCPAYLREWIATAENAPANPRKTRR